MGDDDVQTGMGQIVDAYLPQAELESQVMLKSLTVVEYQLRWLLMGASDTAAKALALKMGSNPMARKRGAWELIGRTWSRLKSKPLEHTRKQPRRQQQPKPPMSVARKAAAVAAGAWT